MLLSLIYEPLAHPYPGDNSSIYEFWGAIRLQVLDYDNHPVKTIIDTQWDIKVLLNWLITNENAILNEVPPIKVSGSSIAGALFDFYNELDPDEENEHLTNTIYDYRIRHGLRFALRGTDTSDVFIGLNKNKHTISLCNDSEQWNFDIELEELFRTVHSIKEKLTST